MRIIRHETSPDRPTPSWSTTDRPARSPGISSGIPGHGAAVAAGQAARTARAGQHPGHRPQLPEARRGGGQGGAGAPDALPQEHELGPESRATRSRCPATAQHPGGLRGGAGGRDRPACAGTPGGPTPSISCWATRARTTCRRATGSSTRAADSSARARASTPSVRWVRSSSPGTRSRIPTPFACAHS